MQLHTICLLTGLLHFSVTEHVLTCSLLVVFAPVEGAVGPLPVELSYSFCGCTHATVAEPKLKMSPKNEWKKNTSQTPVIFEENVMVIAKIMSIE